MRVGVTGAAGLSGRHLVSALLAAGHSVVAHYRGSEDRADGGDHPGLETVAGDLASTQPFRGPCDAIVHIAARSPPATHHDLIDNNIVATARLLDYAREACVQTIIYFSSLSIYGVISVPVVSELTPITAPSLYGLSKFAGEVLLRETATTPRSLALRLPGIIGRDSTRNWLSGVMARAKAQQPIEFYRPDAPFNNAVHVDDLCRFIVQCLERPDWDGHRVLTLAAAGMTTVGGAVNRIVSGLGSRSPLKPQRDGRPSFTISIERAQRDFAYAPRSIEAMLDQFVDDNRSL